MRRLIVSADDFGLSEGVTRGIIDAATRGVLTATSAMVCGPAGVTYLSLAPEFPGHIGAHLQLTDGVPVLPPGQIPSLVEASGRFPRRDPPAGREAEHIRAEWEAQLDRLGAAGIRAHHIDSHHQVHSEPEVRAPYRELALERGLPARLGASLPDALDAGNGGVDLLVTQWFGGDLSPSRFAHIVDLAFQHLGGSGTVELACHPGHCDDALRAASHYASEREAELATLCAVETRSRLADMGVTLV